MTIDQRLNEAADTINAALERTPIPDPPGRVRTPLRAVAAAAVVTLVAVGSVMWLLRPGSEGDVTGERPLTTADDRTVVSAAPTQAEPPRRGPELFGTPSDVVLLFDDGLDGVLAVDPDRRTAARSALTGQAAGDQDPRLHLTGDHLVVGRGEITALELDTRQPTSLGSATVFVPHAVEGRVWLVEWEGGAIGVGEASVWQVAVATGARMTDPRPLGVEGIPAAGVAGLLALESDDGVALWSDGELVRRLGEGEGPGQVADVRRNRIAWCAGDCATLHVTDIYGSDHVYSGPFDPETARFSPDGRLLAFANRKWVHVLDVQAETVERLGPLDIGSPLYLGWSPDGEQLFASTYAYGDRMMQVLRYRLAGGEVSIATLPFGGALGFVVVEEDDTPLYFDSAIEEECTPPGRHPGDRGICTFEF